MTARSWEIFKNKEEPDVSKAVVEHAQVVTYKHLTCTHLQTASRHSRCANGGKVNESPGACISGELLSANSV